VLALNEAFRLIKVRDGERTERIPVMQAILRSIGVAAAKGNPRAQKLFVELMSQAEADRCADAFKSFKAAVDYKQDWSEIAAEREKSRKTGPEPVPHPDDVVIDMTTGEVRIDGPMLQEQKDAQDALRAKSAKFSKMLRDSETKLEANPDDPSLLEMRNGLKPIVDWLWEDAKRDGLRAQAAKWKKEARLNKKR
jgi:hypothetical protein